MSDTPLIDYFVGSIRNRLDIISAGLGKSRGITFFKYSVY